MSTITCFRNIFETTEPMFVEPFQMFTRIKDGNSEGIITAIRTAKTKEEKDDLKKRLPSICWSGKFSKRKSEALIEHSGLICLDIDDINEKDIDSIKKEISDDEYTYACFVSPSGLGLKSIIKIAPGIQYHKEQFLALEKKYNEFLNKYTSTKKNEKKIGDKTVKIDPEQGDYLIVKIDPSGKDVNRVCYESHDVDIYWNDDSEMWYECLEEVVIHRTIEDQNQIIDLLQKWIDKQEIYHEGNRNNYLSKFLYALCRYGVDSYKAREYLMNKFPGLPSSDLDSMTKSCYSKGDFNTQQFSEKERSGSIAQVEVKVAKPVTAFWSINDKGRVLIDSKNFLDFIEANGFGIYRQKKGDKKFHFVHVNNMVVEIVDVLDIKRYILDYVEKNTSALVYNELQMKNRYFENTFLNALPLINVEQIRDNRDSSFIFFTDFYYEITRKGAEKHGYIDLKGKHIWKSQICPQTITKVVDYQTHDFSRFVYNAMGKDVEKYKAACSSLGYAIHTYKKKRLAKLIYACDSSTGELDGMAMGGTGKELLFECLRFVRSVITVDGKAFDKRDKFNFQLISDDTQMVLIDDYEGDIKELFTKITGNFESEKKGMDKISIEFDKSPKLIVTSNSAPKGFSSSYSRRLQLLEFSNHYNEDNTPADEFGDKDFFSDDWNQDDFNALYSFLFDCVRMYLDKGLKNMEINVDSYKWKQLVKNTGNEFAEYFKDYEVEGWKNGRNLFVDYKTETKDDITIQGFYHKIRTMCGIYKWTFDKKGRGIETEIRILKG